MKGGVVTKKNDAHPLPRKPGPAVTIKTFYREDEMVCFPPPPWDVALPVRVEIEIDLGYGMIHIDADPKNVKFTSRVQKGKVA